MYLQIEQISKHYGDIAALDNVSVDVGQQEFVCLLGPSGCGKTTLLRIVSGLVEPDDGRIILDGRDIRPVPATQRGFGIVFQSYSLFPNMTVAENIGYGLRIRRRSRQEIDKRVAELLETIGLPDIGHKHPHQISGGQQQRVALARAIAIDPRLLLLDEPLSALDAKVRLSLRDEVRSLQRRLGIPTLMVTHDQDEAMTMADRVVCMNHGRVEQIGTPEELYTRPATPFVATFLGRMNELELAGGAMLAGRPLKLGDNRSAEPSTAYVRPEHIELLDSGAPRDEVNCFPAVIADLQFEGNITRYRVEVDGRCLDVEALGYPTRHQGDPVTLRIPPDAVRAFG
ncbi:MAG TPA: ATP-binding cassette domain-containing protein [Arenicellales bacterium]|nr:ATP-binding cassette domain-containing protein [Arenicellales bacterium]